MSDEEPFELRIAGQPSDKVVSNDGQRIVAAKALIRGWLLLGESRWRRSRERRTGGEGCRGAIQNGVSRFIFCSRNWLIATRSLVRAGAQNGLKINQARPLILAHHQRTPTNRNRQSWKNSGGFPSKAWPTNWSTQPAMKSAKAY